MEQSLDGLADLEDSLADKAQQLYSATVSSVGTPLWKAKEDADADDGSLLPDSLSGAMSSAWSRRPFASKKRKGRRTEPEPIPKFEMSRFQKVNAPSNVNSVKSEPKPVASQASTNVKLPFGGSGRTSAQTQRPENAGEDWNKAITKQLIRANGGASLPHDQDSQVVLTENRSNSTMSQTYSVSDTPGTVPRSSSFPQNRPPPPRPPLTPSQQQQQRPPLQSSTVSRDWQRQRETSAATQVNRPPPTRRPFPEDDEDDKSMLTRIAKVLPPIPRFGLPRIRLNPFRDRDEFRDYSSASLDAWRAEDEVETKSGLLGIFRKGRDVPSSSSPVVKEESALTPAMGDLMDRCNNGETNNLLSCSEQKSCVSLGRQRAVLDCIKLVSILTIVRQLPYISLETPQNLKDFVSSTVQIIVATVAASIDTWSPYAVAAFLLATESDSLLRRRYIESQCKTVQNSVRNEAQYGCLFLRLTSGSALAKDTPEQIQQAARQQVMAKVQVARLRFFAACLLSALVVMTVSVLQPLAVGVMQSFPSVVNVDQFKTWPFDWRAILASVSSAFALLWKTLREAAEIELKRVSDNPLNVAYEASVFAALALSSMLPTMEIRRKIQPSVVKESEDEEAIEAHLKYTESVADLGASSAARLDLLADGRAIESVLERWKFSLPSRRVTAYAGMSSSSLIRTILYDLLSAVLLFSPIIVFAFAGIDLTGSDVTWQLRWDSLVDVSVVLYAAYSLVRQAMRSCIMSKEAERLVAGFISSLSQALDERKRTLQPQPVNLQLQASISPTTGILVKDLWAAHATRRAWAVR